MAKRTKKSSDLEAILQEIVDSQRSPPLSKEQYETLKVIDELGRPFRFTSEQREQLQYAWGGEDRSNRRVSKAKLKQIDHFLDLSEKELDTWMHNHGPLMRLKERKKRAGEVRRGASELQNAFRSLVATEETYLALESYATIRLILEKRCEDEAINHALAQIDRPSVFALIPPLLNLLEDGAHRLEKATISKPGKDRRAFKQLVRRLAGSYEKAFGKPPSVTDRGNFVRYMARMHDLGIVKQPVGVELIKSTLQEREKG